MSEHKTRFADDATLAHIITLERDLAQKRKEFAKLKLNLHTAVSQGHQAMQHCRHLITTERNPMNTPEIILPAIGQPFAGGFFGGRFFMGTQARAIIFAPANEGEFEDVQYHKNSKGIEGATSAFDGLANTVAMAEAGSPLAKKILKLRIGGFDDWHLMACVPALVLYREIILVPEFKPGTKDGFACAWYWTSTRHAEDSDYAWCQSFDYGDQSYGIHDGSLRARAVRTIAI